MNTRLARSLILVVAHLAILGSLGAKLLYDRATRPRLWLQTVYFDPDLPIRGRYVALQCTAQPEGVDTSKLQDYARITAHLEVRDGKLIAVNDANGSVDVWFRKLSTGGSLPVLAEPMLVFLPEHAVVPDVHGHGKELWVEATIPRKGPPRPIRLGIKENGTITPLDLR